MKFTSFLIQLVVAADQQPARKGLCFKKNRFHSIPALNLEIPLSIYHLGVDHALAFSLSRQKVHQDRCSWTVLTLIINIEYLLDFLLWLGMLAHKRLLKSGQIIWLLKIFLSILIPQDLEKISFKKKVLFYITRLSKINCVIGLSGSCDYAIRSWFEEYSLFKSNSRIGSGNFERYGATFSDWACIFTVLLSRSLYAAHLALRYICGCAQSKGRGGIL